MQLSQAENELLELVRGDDAPTFRVAICFEAGRWSVTTSSPDGVAHGEGKSFSDAWLRQVPGWATDRQPIGLV